MHKFDTPSMIVVGVHASRCCGISSPTSLLSPAGQWKSKTIRHGIVLDLYEKMTELKSDRLFGEPRGEMFGEPRRAMLGEPRWAMFGEAHCAMFGEPRRAMFGVARCANEYASYSFHIVHNFRKPRCAVFRRL